MALSLTAAAVAAVVFAVTVFAAAAAVAPAAAVAVCAAAAVLRAQCFVEMRAALQKMREVLAARAAVAKQQLFLILFFLHWRRVVCSLCRFVALALTSSIPQRRNPCLCDRLMGHTTVCLE